MYSYTHEDFMKYHTPIDIYVYMWYTYTYTAGGKTMKQCSVCNESKDLHEFDRWRNSKGEQVPTARCKACRRDYIRKHYRKKDSSTGMSKEEWLQTVRKPVLSPEEKQELGKAKWEAWYQEWLESGAIEKARAKAERKRIERLQSGVKECTMCGTEKPISQFNKRTRTRKDGSKYQALDACCKVCKNNKAKAHRVSPEGIVARKAYRASPAGKAKAKREKALRDKRNRQATPKWLTKEQKQQIVDIYDHMRDCRATTGEDYHVDHIVPLRGENVCGLHVPWNLQVLPAHVNMSKSNELALDTP